MPVGGAELRQEEGLVYSRRAVVGYWGEICQLMKKEGERFAKVGL